MTNRYPCHCLPGAARCDDPYNWCDRAERETPVRVELSADTRQADVALTRAVAVASEDVAAVLRGELSPAEAYRRGYEQGRRDAEAS